MKMTPLVYSTTASCHWQLHNCPCKFHWNGEFINVSFYFYLQMQSTFFLQSERMDIKIGDFQLPAAFLNAFNTIMILLFVPLMDRLVYPLLKKINRHPSNLQRIGNIAFFIKPEFFKCAILWRWGVCMRNVVKLRTAMKISNSSHWIRTLAQNLAYSRNIHVATESLLEETSPTRCLKVYTSLIRKTRDSTPGIQLISTTWNLLRVTIRRVGITANKISGW